MAELIKLTKSELRIQQNRLNQLQKYLPTLQLKKAMLQIEVNESRQEIAHLEDLYKQEYALFESYGALLSQHLAVDPADAIQVEKIHKRIENIAGIEVPYFEKISYQPFEYSLFDTPPWMDSVILGLRKVLEGRVKIDIAHEKKQALEKELRDVSIRVNLFEKILIPRALQSIKKIKVFLGDQQLAAVSQAKVAKSKIETNKRLALLNKRAASEVNHAY